MSPLAVLFLPKLISILREYLSKSCLILCKGIMFHHVRLWSRFCSDWTGTNLVQPCQCWCVFCGRSRFE